MAKIFGQSFDIGSGRTVSCTLCRCNDSGTFTVALRIIGLPATTVLHWGIGKESANEWASPVSVGIPLPPDSTDVKGAVQTLFTPSGEIELKFDSEADLPAFLLFVLYIPPNTWIKDGRTNFAFGIRQHFEASLGCEELEDCVNQATVKLPQNVEQIIERWQIDAAPRPIRLHAVAYADEGSSHIEFYTDASAQLVLHWGFAADENGTWSCPVIEQVCFDSTNDFFTNHPWDDRAMQSCFEFLDKKGHKSLQWLKLRISGLVSPNGIYFVLKERHANQWYKKDSKLDFCLRLPKHSAWEQLRKAHEAEVRARALEEEEQRKKRDALWESAVKEFHSTRSERMLKGTLSFKTFTLGQSSGEVDVTCWAADDRTSVQVEISICVKVICVLHWGVLSDAGQRSRRGGGLSWMCPPERIRPPNTEVADPQRACTTPFTSTGSVGDIIQKITISIAATPCPSIADEDPGVEPEFGGVVFVLKSEDGWLKTADSRDMQVRLVGGQAVWTGGQGELVEKILQAEIEWQAMTLMHRYNLIRESIEIWDSQRSTSERQCVGDKKRVEEWADVFKEGVVRTFPASSALTRSVIFDQSNRESEDKDFWEWLYVWGRFAYMGLLDWQRNYNTKPRELAGATEAVTFKVAEMWRDNPKYRPLIRLLLSTMSRGGNQGQAIRDRILDIMHKHKIPEHGANFYEQWHQKLHNNTTPDDIGICRAVIRFLQSGGDMGQYWSTLHEHGISKERLASYDRKVTSEPYMVQTDRGSLIHDFGQYLAILQDVHDALDLQNALNHAHRFLPDGVIGVLGEIVREAGENSGVKLGRNPGQGAGSSRDAHARFMKVSQNSLQRLRGEQATALSDLRLEKCIHLNIQVADVRRQILIELNRNDIQSDKVRELLYLEFALEQQQIVLIQGTQDFSTDQLTRQIQEILVNMSGHDVTNAEFHALCADWNNLARKAADNCFSDSRENSLLLKALVDRVSRVVGDMVDSWQNSFGPKSFFLGTQVGTDKKVLDVFVDEALRGSALFSLSLCAKRIEPLLRKAAQLPPWQLISVVPKVRGHLVAVDRLTHIQDKVFESPTILLSGCVSGEEEIPTGVQAVLVRSAAVSPDILSHVSVRARNAQVLLAVCFEPTVTAQIEKDLVGEWVEILCSKDGSNLSVSKAEQPKLQKSLSHTISKMFYRSVTQEKLEDVLMSGQKASCSEMDLTKMSKQWCIGPSSFTKEVVGSKSLNLQHLAPLLPTSVVTPRAVAFPYGCFQKTLNDPINYGAAFPRLQAVLSKLSPDTSNQDAEFVFNNARDIICNLEPPQALMDQFHTTVETALSCTGSSTTMTGLLELCGDDKGFTCLCAVWASLFALRPWVSLSKANRSYHELNMAVLVQELMPASYSFVLHSKNPFSGDPNEMYGELVAGLGETLVGNYPGRALSWKMKREGDPYIIAFPSKSHALRSKPCLIFRSDSNGEDLEGFAGAGLFESVTSEIPIRVCLRYHDLRLIVDHAYRNRLLKAIGQLAFDIEEKFGSAQDIEGCVIGEEQLAVVQTRPQV